MEEVETQIERLTKKKETLTMHHGVWTAAGKRVKKRVFKITERVKQLKSSLCFKIDNPHVTIPFIFCQYIRLFWMYNAHN